MAKIIKEIEVPDRIIGSIWDMRPLNNLYPHRLGKYSRVGHAKLGIGQMRHSGWNIFVVTTGYNMHLERTIFFVDAYRSPFDEYIVCGDRKIMRQFYPKSEIE